LLAFQESSRIEDYIAKVDLLKLTTKTVTSKSRLRKILAHVRRQGYAAIQDELDYGIVSVAVPVFGPQGEILASINCSTATTRVTMNAMEETRLPELRKAARSIEVELRRYPILVHSIRSATS
jgi:IclR family pca regulon transcriptional regulator